MISDLTREAEPRAQSLSQGAQPAAPHVCPSLQLECRNNVRVSASIRLPRRTRGPSQSVAPTPSDRPISAPPTCVTNSATANTEIVS